MKVKTLFNNLIVRYAKSILRWRWMVLLLTISASFTLIAGGSKLQFRNDYRMFFSKENSQLEAFDALQDIYTKNDNILFVIAPKDKNAFNRDLLAKIETLTEEAWKLPYALRVDAITNFQNNYSEEDDLIVESLIEDAQYYNDGELASAEKTAVTEPYLMNLLINKNASVTGVNITFQLPGKSIFEITEAVQEARKLQDDIFGDDESVDTHLTGLLMLNNAFSESSQEDMSTLYPLMIVGIILLMGYMLRSLSGSLSTLLVIIFSALAGMGLAGWLGINISPPLASAPVLILTLAIADCIHILISAQKEMLAGKSRKEALIESLRLNMMPIFITSVTTAIGFLSLNMSDSPPFRDLGNVTAVGVMIAFILSVTLLPALISLLPFKASAKSSSNSVFFDRLANWVIDKQKLIMVVSIVVTLVLAGFISSNNLNDQFIQYFDKSVTFRQDTDFAMNNLTGLYTIEFSLSSGKEDGISDPAYLKKVDEFETWIKQQDHVLQVTSFTEVMKKLNKNLHEDKEKYYRIPESKALAAQYLLLYEMSLPYGLDLNNRINVDKSSTKLTITLDDLSTNDARALAEKSENWLIDNAPEAMYTKGSSAMIMFSHIAERNIKSMIFGTTAALVIISFILIIALRSWKFGLLSLIPNLTPAILAFGFWGIIISEIGLALSMVSGMTLGIVVDDTVHFLSKYLRARREKKFNPENAIRYAFNTVGPALVVTSIALIGGFLVLTQSSFKMNSGMGLLTAITIGFALLADLLFLPPIILRSEAKKKLVLTRSKQNEYQGAFSFLKILQTPVNINNSQGE